MTQKSSHHAKANIFTKIQSIFRHPLRRICYLYSDWRKDRLSRSGKIPYAGRFILIVGLPKSGTNWLSALIAEFPGFIQMGRSQIRRKDPSYHEVPELDLAPGLFTSVAPGLCTVLKLHTRWSEANMQLLRELNIRPVVLLRDLRDMMISRYYHVMAEPEHWMHDTLKELDFEEGFYRSLFWGEGGYEGAPYQDVDPVAYWADWIRNWQAAAKNDPEGMLLLSYEEMKKDLLDVLQQVSQYYNLGLSKQALEDARERQVRHHKKSGGLATNLRRPFRDKNTFRKGLCGEWKNELSERHLEVFERVAGDVLTPAPSESTPEGL